MATPRLGLTLSVLLAALAHAATPAPTGRAECRDDCIPASCMSDWWRATNAVRLSGAAVLVFFATFLPRVLVRLVIFVLTKLPFIRQTAEDFRTSCMGSSTYLISVSLVLAALNLSKLAAFFCRLPTYIWGVFFLVWLYSLFDVVESLAVRRFILRLTVMLIIALIIYSSALGSSETLKYSILAVIGISIALGFVPSFHNVVGGLYLAFNSQFKIDDFIHVGDAQGFVHRVSLRYTTVVSMDGTKLYVPNSFFLYKPMVNFSQRPKQDIDIRVKVAPSTPADTLRTCLSKLEVMLQSLHVALTSHEENQSDLRHGEKWERFAFVAMEELYQIRVYSYTEELESRKYAMIKSEVWLAVMEIMEDLGIEVLSQHQRDGDAYDNPFSESPHTRRELESPFVSEINAVIGTQSGGTRGFRTQL
ncbi:hypothetical protein PybrP1_010250 [[Pythium] brassicae (nom. inval.)]|nr:hypothetical protein PybrP1_010250 [[Pythium] brassicae (nom. inval.)]